MKKIVFHLLILLINVVCLNKSSAQNKFKNQSYTQTHFDKNKVFDETYQLWWHKNRWLPNTEDTLAYFVDDRNYKGLLNYGVTFRARDNRNFYFMESNTMYFLKVEINECEYNPKDSLINIEGFVSGGWYESALKGKIQNHIDVFLGEKKDTITSCYLGNACYDKIISKETVESKLRNREIDEFAVLDTFPSFYFINYFYYRTKPQGKRPFKIRGKVTKNTLLAFGGRGCYSEIFDVGSMIYYPNKSKRKKKNITKNLPKPIIINNKLISDIEKEKQQAKEINYYTHTEKAENYILKRQYAFAKESYLLLDKEYKTIFARDIHNAIRCAILSSDYKNAYYFGKKLARKGIDKKYFNAIIFNSLKKNSEWNQFMADYDSLYKESQSKRDIHLKEQLEKLVKEDQADYGLENRKESQVLYESTERVTNKLIDLLKREGYPSEEKIGVYTKNDTAMISSPDYNVLIRHAVQQNPKNLATLNEILDKSNEDQEYDKKRSPNHRGFITSCFHVYKGNLYNNKSCGNNDLMVRKIKFMFKNPNNFIVDQGDYIEIEYDKENPEDYDKYYEENFNFIMKLTDDWGFYED